MLYPSTNNELVSYEGEVINQIELIGDMTTSDAQGIVMLREELMYECFRARLSPIETAKKIIDSVTVKA